MSQCNGKDNNFLSNHHLTQVLKVFVYVYICMRVGLVVGCQKSRVWKVMYIYICRSSLVLVFAYLTFKIHNLGITNIPGSLDLCWEKNQPETRYESHQNDLFFMLGNQFDDDDSKALHEKMLGNHHFHPLKKALNMRCLGMFRCLKILSFLFPTARLWESPREFQVNLGPGFPNLK